MPHAGFRGSHPARSSASQASRGLRRPTGKIASTPSPMNFNTSPPKAWTATADAVNQPPSAAMTANGRLGLGQGGEAAQDRHRATPPGWSRRLRAAKGPPARARRYAGRDRPPAWPTASSAPREGSGARRSGRPRAPIGLRGVNGAARSSRAKVRPDRSNGVLHAPHQQPLARPASADPHRLTDSPASIAPPSRGKPEASITLRSRPAIAVARRRAMIGCGTASLSAPASGTSSATKRAPSSRQQPVGARDSLASSTSQVSVERSSMDRPCGWTSSWYHRVISAPAGRWYRSPHPTPRSTRFSDA